MGLASFFVKTFIGGATAVGIGAMIKATKRNKQRRLQEQAEEERRKNTPCHFVDGISENAFSRIVKRSSKRFRRLKVTRIDGAVIYLEYYSQSGLSSYNAVIDFNDYGHITGRYWLENENEDSNLPTAFADYLSKQLIEKLESFDDDFECDRSESSNTNKNTVKYSSNTNNTNQSNVDKNVFPSFCRNCGVRLIDKPYWWNYCGTQIRAKREWYCAVCGDHLNEQKNFNSESGCWVCLKCKSINRVKEHFY